MKAKVSITVGRESWRGDVLAYTGGYLRVALHPDGRPEWPVWDAATPAACVLHEGHRRYASDGTVLKQDKDLVWVQVPPTWSGSDRRRTPRQLGGFSVHFESDGRFGHAECLDISASGIRLRTPVPIAEKSRLSLRFRLPSDRKLIAIDGIVQRTHARPDDAEVGIKFADPRLLDSVRIAAYCCL